LIPSPSSPTWDSFESSRRTIYDLDLARVERTCADFYKVFSIHDAQLYEEKYNLLNAFLAAVPGNYTFNLRYLYLLNTNYADYSFLFTLHCGELRNRHLRQEYLAVLETNHHSPYFLNLHYHDVAHTMMLGRTGAGKSFLLNFLITNLQKYDPQTVIFDLGGSFENVTHLFDGSYVRVGLESQDFRINPFSLPPTKENLDFLALFLKVLMQASGNAELDPATERDLYQQIENIYALDPSLRTLGVLANTLRQDLAGRLARGDDPEDVMRQIAQYRATDKTNPEYYARHTVEKAMAELKIPPARSGTSSDADGENNREPGH
jgi:type IV secretory pathway VirB4 component